MRVKVGRPCCHTETSSVGFPAAVPIRAVVREVAVDKAILTMLGLLSGKLHLARRY